MVEPHYRNGRILIVRFKCSRCGRQQDEPYETLCAKEVNDYVKDYKDLHPPEEWHEMRYYGRILCPECFKKIDVFLNGE